MDLYKTGLGWGTTVGRHPLNGAQHAVGSQAIGLALGLRRLMRK